MRKSEKNRDAIKAFLEVLAARSNDRQATSPVAGLAGLPRPGLSGRSRGGQAKRH
jgi:hypothetical protein